MNIRNIETSRLILIPITLEICEDLLENSYNEIEKIGIKAYKNWPTEDTMDILPIIYNVLKESKVPSGFETWMIILKENMSIVGDIGFHGKPDKNGEVEVGFGLVENERGKGIGFEALEAIISWLRTMESVKLIKAESLVTNKPSGRILEKVGLKEVKRDSELIYWELGNN